jgi:two-component system nitrogen regulation response regulator GlnG
MPSRNILLLSDGSKIFSVLKRFFTDEGYQTMTAYSSQGAIEAMRQGDFHLLIVRMNQNRPEGLSLLKTMREQHPRMMAIILKGEHEVNSPIEAYQVRDNEEIFIPCGWPGLRRLVAYCLPG